MSDKKTSVGRVRTAVAVRDIGCMARLDPDSGPCHDQWGAVMDNAKRFLPLADGEMDYVRLGATGKRHVLVSDHIFACAGHHRGTGPSAGRQWATSHRPLLRAYLDSWYNAEVGASDDDTT